MPVGKRIENVAGGMITIIRTWWIRLRGIGRPHADISAEGNTYQVLKRWAVDGVLLLFAELRPHLSAALARENALCAEDD